ncbi:MAG: SpoIIE family protein phosphatase [Ignavibacteriaceae bacterium]|jgi:sigma-B regulation protein RsbU (phosphoserine phosphatase)|nr:SpoIIE family protein phosphatase [Ignavibacteriaceae bacterium]
MMNNENAKGTILLVEDEFNIAKLFSYNLTKAGFRVEVGTNGQEGFVLAQKIMPDIIISDVMMPVMDGYEFRRNLLKDPELRAIPFVFLTAKGEEDDVLQGYDLEIEDYIIKTASPKIVIAKVSAILKSLERERVKVVDEVQKAADSMGAKVVPDEVPPFSDFSVRHWHQPYKNVPGGDFIDYVKVDEDQLVIVFGDVMGKRWGAWYFAVAYAGYVRSATRFVLESSSTDLQPSEIIKKVNDSVYKDERISEVFVTLTIVVLDRKKKVAKYAGAGDLPLIFKRKEVKTVHSKGLLLGFSNNEEYENIELPLESGDELFLFTDGITESRNPQGELYGEERLLEFIKNMPEDKDALELIRNEIYSFSNNEVEDDISVISIKYL